MRFIHTADNHLGATPDSGMPWSKERAQALWDTFRKIIAAAGDMQADLLLIAGDLFHQQPLQRECKEVNYLFSTIPATRVVLIAGNHDYITPSSPYLTYPWEKNVTVLSSETPDSVYFPELHTEVHGFSYHRREIREALCDDLTAPDDGRFHILLAHGGDENHVPLHMNRLARSGFDYIALGHIHQPHLWDKAPIAFCGSPEPLDRTDIGRRGYIVGELSEAGCQYRWQASASCQYRTLTATVNTHTTTAQLVDTLQKNLRQDGRSLYRVTLTGPRDPSVRFDPEVIRQAGRIVEITDHTEPAYDLNALQAEHAHDLVSRYIQALSGPEATPLEQKALHYGLRALLNLD
ncbi:MAG: metallophosphoesterase [Lachnospiraceae bacterium]|nr:metallophosphoesterase [Lachnospiraceae bacterium]